MDHAQARALLASERARLQRLLQADTGEPQAAELGGEVDDADRRNAEQTGMAVDQLLGARWAALQRAEARLAAGSYGRSVRSGQPIPDERLEDAPLAELTVEEAATAERGAPEEGDNRVMPWPHGGAIVSVLGRRLPSGLRDPPGAPGRRRDCDVLERLLAIRSSESRALVVRGEPGLGRTALLDHLAEHASSCRVAPVASVDSRRPSGGRPGPSIPGGVGSRLESRPERGLAGRLGPAFRGRCGRLYVNSRVDR